MSVEGSQGAPAGGVHVDMLLFTNILLVDHRLDGVSFIAPHTPLH